jgi:hypothetical protein
LSDLKHSLQKEVDSLSLSLLSNSFSRSFPFFLDSMELSNTRAILDWQVFGVYIFDFSMLVVPYAFILIHVKSHSILFSTWKR